MNALEQRLEAIRNHPLHRYMGLQSLSAGSGRAELSLHIESEGTLNPAGMMHGGVLYVLSDVAAYAATLTLLKPEEEAVTHDLHLSVMRGGKSGMTLAIRSEVIKRGRQLVFIDVRTEYEAQILATATVTKSIVST